MIVRSLVGVLAVAIAAGDAGAVDPTRAAELTALPAAGVGTLRHTRELRHGPIASAAWQAFARRGTWSVSWDRATGVPNRIWGSGLAAPGANASPAIAEALARRVLVEHLALLAPGAEARDFTLVSNHDDGAIRSVGFAQRHGDRRVIGGQVSFRFRRDRLFVIASEALPQVRTAEPIARLAANVLLRRATPLLQRALALPDAAVTSAGAEVVLPLVGRDGVLGYRVVAPLTIDGGVRGKYRAYVDAERGVPIAVQSLHRYATGTVKYRGVDRHPGRGRVDRPAPRARVLVGQTAATTAADGTVSWTPEAPQTVTTSVAGDLVRVEDLASPGVMPSVQLPIVPGGEVVWDASASTETDAAVVVYLATNTAKAYIADAIDPTFVGLTQQTVARVNHASACNAYYDGQSINFFHATLACQNTGLLEDVVYHEYAHALHDGEIIDGVGYLDAALAEGTADFFAASITGDPGTARGFDYTDAPLRHLDPAGVERVWPDDIAEVHQTGLILGGALWDLRTALVGSLGPVDGVVQTNRIYLGILRRASSIPSALVEALAADDDDGDLANGTPNECAIRGAFGRHGLRTVRGTIEAPGALPAGAETETSVGLALAGLSSCPADAIDTALLVWSPGRTNVPVAGTRAMMLEAPGRYRASLPLPVDAPLYFAVKLLFADGTAQTFADNLADPSYTVYRGDTVPLYCTDFEADPFAEGWTTGASDGASPWQWGPPAAGIASDPTAAFSGTRILAQSLGGPYAPRQTSWVALPPIDIGAWTDVRLQYRRWLAVEDRQADQARISSSGEQAWITGGRDATTELHHIDREWRFHDVPVSGYQPARVLDVRFELTSNGSFELGGWAIDDVCVVANVRSVCGDGVRSPTELCDTGDANGDTPDACRDYCKPARCGDGVVDTDEECDDGAETTYCSAACESYVLPAAVGCCSSSDGGGALLGVLGVLAFRRPGRRARCPARCRARAPGPSRASCRGRR